MWKDFEEIQNTNYKLGPPVHCWPTTPNIVRRNNVVSCCVCLHGTTTILALVGTCWVQFETGQTFGPTSPNISIASVTGEACQIKTII